MDKRGFEIDNKALKKIITVCTFIAIGVILIIMLNFDNKTAFRERVIQSVKNQEYIGVVTVRYYDTDNHNSPTLVLNNNDKVVIYGQLYNQIKISDSIVKEKGSTKIFVYRKDKKIVLDNLTAIK
ncbi:hypothetical protein [Flavobacterium sp.]|uniref:hypothetical protein n=1 Tax=Flavobacterium sp. TaxID=239 RepID=UPI0025B8816F|nr:hypothetical protein [Flavobacterium sp.]